MKTFKNLPILFVALSALVSTALAHDMNRAGSKEGFLGLKPEYLHVLLNPLPVYGLGIGIVTLAVGLLRRNNSLQIAGLIVTAICAASAWPVLYYGQHGYNELAPLLDNESRQWLDEHMERAEKFIYFFYATAVLAIAAITLPKKLPKTRLPLAALTFVLGAASLGIGGWISRAGGEVSTLGIPHQARAGECSRPATHKYKPLKQKYENKNTTGDGALRCHRFIQHADKSCPGKRQTGTQGSRDEDQNSRYA